MLAAPAQADITVDTHADVVAADGLCSLREAVAAAADCGTGTIHLPGGAPYLLTSTLALPAGATVRIDGEGAVLRPSGEHRVLIVPSAATVRLSNLTITGGTATPAGARGGGILNYADLTLVNVTVTDNAIAEAGPGVSGGAAGGPGNGGGRGGGIYNEPSGALTLLRSTVIGNTAGTGGAGGVAGNPGGAGGIGGQGGSGGGIFNAGSLTVIESTVTGNAAGRGGRGGAGQSAAAAGTGGRGGHGGHGGHGGGIASNGMGVAGRGTVTIERSTISGNAAGRGADGFFGATGGSGPAGGDGGRGGAGGNGGEGGDGGGVHSALDVVVNVVNSTIAGNTGGRGGNGGAAGAGGPPGGGAGLQGPGGVGGGGNDGGSAGGLWFGGASAITHATIAQNQAGAPGAGGPGGAGNPAAANGSAGGVADGGALELGATTSVQNTIFAANGPASAGGGCSLLDATDLGGNIASGSRDCPGLPRDPRLGPLASNGGPTQTMGLRPDSPAIGLVSTNCATTDQRGVRRPVGGRCDAGAVEFVPAAGGPTPSLGSPKAKFNLKKRRLTLTYAVSGPGTLAVRVLMKKGKRVGRRTVQPAAAGHVKVRVKLAKKAIKAFKARGRLRLRTRAVFTPTGGTPITKSKRVTLRKRSEKSRVQVRGADPGAAPLAPQRMGG